MMITIITSKDIHLILMTRIAPMHKTKWNNIQYFDRLFDILCVQLVLYSVAELVTTMSNAIPTEIAAA